MSSGWCCILCEFINQNINFQCEMCDTPRPSKYYFQSQSNHSQQPSLPQSYTSMLDYYQQQSLLLNDDEYESKSNIGKYLQLQNINQWQCPLCTMLNHSGLPYCEACGTFKNEKKSIQQQSINDFNFAKQLQGEEDHKFNPTDMISSDRAFALKLQNEFDSAIKTHQKRKDLQSLTALMATLLRQNVSETKQKGLKNLFKGDAIRHVHILLEKILNSDKLLEYVNKNEVQQTIDLIHKYWNTFSQSMNIIKSKQKQIDVLIDFSKKWTVILQKRQNFKHGETLSDNDVFFMRNVSKIFSFWFKGENDIDAIAKKWVSLHEMLKEQHIFWQRKTAEIEEEIKSKMQKEQQANSKWGWRKIFGSVAKWIGVAAVAVGAIVGIVFCGPIGLGVMAVGAGVAYLGHKTEQSAETKINIYQERMLSFDGTIANVQFICSTFDVMKKDSSMMEKFFDDFMILLKSPKEDLSEIIEMQQEEECMFEVIEDNVENMVESFQTLRKTFRDAIKEMDLTVKQEKYGYVTLN